MFETENFSVQITDPMLYNRLRTLSAEYDLSIESLVNIAIKRLADNVDFVRDLRTGQSGGGVSGIKMVQGFVQNSQRKS